MGEEGGGGVKDSPLALVLSSAIEFRGQPSTLCPRMKLSRTVHFNPALFGVIPFLNVIFLLLIFFEMSRSFMLQPGVSVSLPLSPFQLGPQRQPQLVSITAAPVPSIYFHNQRISFEEFAASLAKDRPKDGTLIIRADRSTPYDLVVRVVNEGLGAGYGVVLATAPDKK